MIAPDAKDSQDQSSTLLSAALGLQQGQSPFPWQIELLRRFRESEPVSSLDIPTGLGKTSVMAIWLVARALGARVPRRLAYVVDRRAVVDQATAEAERLRAWVAGNSEVAKELGLKGGKLPISTLRGQYVDNREWLENPSLPAIIVGTVDMIGSRLLFSGYGVSSKMRPYHAGLLGVDTLVALDEAHLVPAFEHLLRQIEREIDVFGPKDAALRSLIPPFKLLSLSATGRQTVAAALTLSDKDRAHPVVNKRLTAKKTLGIIELDSEEADAADEPAKKSKSRRLADVLADQAWAVTEKGKASVRCLVFCNARADAVTVAAKLRKMAKRDNVVNANVELFVGARRVRERTMAAQWLVEHGFVERENGTRAEPQGPTFLIATSAGEVGVDMDADHMVCDLVAWERIVQRLGRANRRGDGDAKVVVVVQAGPLDEEALRKAGGKFPKEQQSILFLFEKRKKANEAREKLKSGTLSASESKSLKKQLGAFKDADAKKLAEYEAEVKRHSALRRLLKIISLNGGSLSPAALLALRNCQYFADTLRDATTVEPLRPELTRPLVEAWSMTSLDEHPGRPEVGPWLRGWQPNDPPQTTVVWRRHLPVRADGFFDAKAAKRFFEAAPLHTSEQLETETHLVLDWLIERAAAVSKATGEEALLDAKQVVAIILNGRGEPKGSRTLGQIADLKSKGKSDNKQVKTAREELEKLLVGATLVIDARLGGLAAGLLDEKANAIAETADDASTNWLNRPDAADVPVTGFRIRDPGANEADESAWRATPETGWVRRHLFVTSMADGEPSGALAIDGWVGDAATEDDRAESNRPQLLKEHECWTAREAIRLGRRLGIGKEYRKLLALAARLHDEGKRAARWQRAFKAPADWRENRPYAKTKGPIDFDLLDGYRHELGSLPYVENDAVFKKLSDSDKDLVLHLVAAHHGFARPVIGASGCDDAPPSIVEERARAVALRFARLSRRWGPWGLAWWEALLRASDQIASRRNQQSATAQGGGRPQ